jgi:hypothetical protein
MSGVFTGAPTPMYSVTLLFTGGAVLVTHRSPEASIAIPNGDEVSSFKPLPPLSATVPVGSIR